MPDQFTDITTTGYGGRIVNSIKTVVIGLILFIASFVLLYWNEGRVDLSNIAKTAAEISSTTNNSDSSLNGKLISTTGNINSNETIGDNLFLNPDKFIVVKREVEMYSWIEKSESSTKKNIGGSETTETKYTYSKDWEENPVTSSNFKNKEGHENPEKSLDSYTNKITNATIGVYNFDPRSITLPSLSRLLLNPQNINLNNDAILANNNYIFIKKSIDGTNENPQIGDLRISYHVLHNVFEGTVFGKLNESKIDPYFDENGNNLYHLFIGTREQGISTLHSEYIISLWILRLLGFLLMWFGLLLLFGPISVLLDVFPIFGVISRLIVGIITFLVSLILTLVTILVSIIVHDPTVLVITLFVVIGIIISFFVVFKNKKKAGRVMAATTNSVQDSVQNTPQTSRLEIYIRDAKTRGMSNDEIRQQLLSVGWPNNEINKFLD